MVLVNWRGDLCILIVELEAIQDGLLLELDLPGGASDAVARRYCRHDQLGVFDFESLVLVEGNELDVAEGALDVLQRECVENRKLLLLYGELVHGLCANFGYWRCSKDALQIVEHPVFVQERKRADLLDGGMGDEYVVYLLIFGAVGHPPQSRGSIKA